jgi:hypothetical protein
MTRDGRLAGGDIAKNRKQLRWVANKSEGLESTSAWMSGRDPDYESLKVEGHQPCGHAGQHDIFVRIGDDPAWTGLRNILPR